MGLSNIDKDKQTAEVFILIGEDDYRGKGIGKIAMKYLIQFAFTQLKLKELRLEVDKYNLPAINLYRSLGFKDTRETKKEYAMSLFNS
jgi:RimJ/RimL family protein N-acetyltransferase